MNIYFSIIVLSNWMDSVDAFFDIPGYEAYISFS